MERVPADKDDPFHARVAKVAIVTSGAGTGRVIAVWRVATAASEVTAARGMRGSTPEAATAVVENTIPSEARLALYMSARYLQELEIALRLAGIPVRYQRPGTDSGLVPRLFVEHPGQGDLGEIICTLPLELGGQDLAWDAPDPPWWFMWCPRGAQTREPICPAVDMKAAAEIIAARLREETR